jgi:hypothetical protein
MELGEALLLAPTIGCCAEPVMQKRATKCTKQQSKDSNLWHYLPMDLVLRSQSVSLTELAERSHTCKQFRDVYQSRFAAVEEQLEKAARAAFDSRLIEVVLVWLSGSSGGHKQRVEFVLTQEGDWPDPQELLAHRRVKLSVSAGESGQERRGYSVLLENKPKRMALLGSFGCLTWCRAPSGLSRGPDFGIPWSTLFVESARPHNDPGLRSVGCPFCAAPALGLLLLGIKQASAAPSDKHRRRRALGLCDPLCVVRNGLMDSEKYTWRDAGVVPEHVAWALDASWVVAKCCRDRAFSCSLGWIAAS